MKTLSHYATTIKNGRVIRHDGEEKYAVYIEDIKAIQERAEKWHLWVSAHYPNAYDCWGTLLNNLNYDKMRAEYEKDL